jgi:hypothetical protein
MMRHRNISRLQESPFALSILLVGLVAFFCVGSAAATAGAVKIGNSVNTANGVQGAFAASAMDNIFGAGLTTPPDPGGNGGGVLPFQAAVPTGTVTVTFTDVTGKTSFSPGIRGGPDGYSHFDTNISAYGGISGLIDTKRYFYLVGVFLDGGQPTTPPPTLNFTKDHSFQSLGPELGQVFFVGDGLTHIGKGEVQDFTVPSGATTLYLGFADAPEASGPPGAYQDNKGSVTGTIDFTP